MFKNTAGDIAIFAYFSATGLPADGEAANISVNYAQDGTYIGTLSGTVSEDSAVNMPGYYTMDHTDEEANCDLFRGRPVCSTSGVSCAPIETYTQSVMRGTEGAATAAVWTAARAGALTDWIDGERLDLILDAILVDTATTLQAQNAAIYADTNAILIDTANMQPKLGSPAVDISADIAAVKVDSAAVLVDTGTDGVKLDYTETTDGLTLTVIIELMIAFAAGDVVKSTSGSDTILSYKKQNGSTNRIVITVDTDGNRTVALA